MCASIVGYVSATDAILIQVASRFSGVGNSQGGADVFEDEEGFVCRMLV